jgi:glycosyltransferase involved in cell wall biosynthesis
VIAGLFTELAGPGGIQRAGRLTAAVLNSFASSRGQICQFLSLNDSPSASPVRLASEEIAFAGFGRSKPRFSASACITACRQPRLILALHPHLAPVVAAMKSVAPAARTVIFAHGLEVWTPLPFIQRRSLQLADLVFAPSTDTARHLIEQQGLRSSKVQKLPWSLGPDFDAGSSCGTAPLPDGFPRGRIILTVGRWDAQEAYKGVDHLIMSLPRLLQTIPSLHLVAIGSGTDVPRLQSLAIQHDVTGHVHFLSALPQEQLGPAYESCDVFALPSRGEGFGLVFIEAMSHAKPVIGGAHGGTPDVIEEGKTGYLVRYGDVDQLTDRLRHLLTDEKARRGMGASAFQRVCSEYTFDRFSQRLSAALAALSGQP